MDVILCTKSRMCDDNMHPQRTGKAGSVTLMLTSVRGTSSKHDKHAQNREHHAKERRILRQGLSLGPNGSKPRPNAKSWQAEDPRTTAR